MWSARLVPSNPPLLAKFQLKQRRRETTIQEAVGSSRERSCRSGWNPGQPQRVALAAGKERGRDRGKHLRPHSAFPMGSASPPQLAGHIMSAFSHLRHPGSARESWPGAPCGLAPEAQVGALKDGRPLRADHSSAESSSPPSRRAGGGARALRACAL